MSDASKGTIRELWRYPVKSLAGERLEAADLGPLGIEGDRRWAVCDRATGQALTAKRVPELLLGAARTDADGIAVVLTLPDGTEHVAGASGTDAAVSAWLAREVEVRAASPEQGSTYAFPEDHFDDTSPITEIATLPGAFFDATPLHLLTTAALAALATAHPDGAWDVRRFRPNVVVESDGDGFIEEAWLGSPLQLGTASALAVAPCPRCSMTTRAPPGLERDVDVLRTINAANSGSAGIYAVITEPGQVKVGDAVG